MSFFITNRRELHPLLMEFRISDFGFKSNIIFNEINPSDLPDGWLAGLL